MSERSQPQPDEDLKREPLVEPMQDSPAQRGRRKRLRSLAAAGMVLLAADKAIVEPVVAYAKSEQSPKHDVEATDSPEVLNNVQPIFENPEAQKIAEDLHLTPGKIFLLHAESYQHLDAHVLEDITTEDGGKFLNSQELLPIFPPGVMEHATVITAAAKEQNLPVNFVALISAIETSGDETKTSPTDAKGLFQIEPSYHIERFQRFGYLPPEASYPDYLKAKAHNPKHPSLVSLQQYNQAFYNPEASARAGAEFLRELVDETMAKEPGLNIIEILARAGAAYNGGHTQETKDPDDMPRESELYFDFVTRYIYIGEIAARLRAGGMSDADIVKALHSKEIDARVYAFAGVPKGTDYANYAAGNILNSFEEPGILPSADLGLSRPVEQLVQTYAATVNQRYHSYINHMVPQYSETNPATITHYGHTLRPTS